MNNICTICKATIEHQWSVLQNEIRKRGNLENLLTLGFVERCIYCYKNLVELTEKREHEWYQEVVKAAQRRLDGK